MYMLNTRCFEHNLYCMVVLTYMTSTGTILKCLSMIIIAVNRYLFMCHLIVQLRDYYNHMQCVTCHSVLGVTHECGLGSTHWTVIQGEGAYILDCMLGLRHWTVIRGEGGRGGLYIGLYVRGNTLDCRSRVTHWNSCGTLFRRMINVKNNLFSMA